MPVSLLFPILLIALSLKDSFRNLSLAIFTIVGEGSMHVTRASGSRWAIIAASIPGPLPISRIVDGFIDATSSVMLEYIFLWLLERDEKKAYSLEKIGPNSAFSSCLPALFSKVHLFFIHLRNGY